VLSLHKPTENTKRSIKLHRGEVMPTDTMIREAMKPLTVDKIKQIKARFIKPTLPLTAKEIRNRVRVKVGTSNKPLKHTALNQLINRAMRIIQCQQ
jgi:hypothetical protein